MITTMGRDGAFLLGIVSRRRGGEMTDGDS